MSTTNRSLEAMTYGELSAYRQGLRAAHDVLCAYHDVLVERRRGSINPFKRWKIDAQAWALIEYGGRLVDAHRES